MAITCSPVTSQQRIELVNDALMQANAALASQGIQVGSLGQWPPKTDEIPGQWNERPDVDLEMTIEDELHPIDIVYIRATSPEKSEQLKTVSQLAEDIKKKALAHFEALSDKDVFISSSGSKFNLGSVNEKDFFIDPEEYIVAFGLRIAFSTSDTTYKPIKASDIHSHTQMQVIRVIGSDIIWIKDDFDDFRTDGKKGIFCDSRKAISIAKDHIVSGRQADAESYKKKYIIISRQPPQ